MILNAEKTEVRAIALSRRASAMPFAAPTVVLFWVLMGGALMSLAARVAVPVPGSAVPMTLQLTALLVIGLTFPGWMASASAVTYVAAGSLGAPVFSTPGGLAGPTGGYLAGFLLAAVVMSALRRQERSSLLRLMMVGLLGTVIVFVSGVSWLGVWLNGNGTAAVQQGLTPFVWKALVEWALALTLVAGGRRLVKAGAARFAPGP